MKRGKRGKKREFSFFRLDGSQGVWGFRGIVGRSSVQGAATMGLGAWRSMHHLAMGRYAHFNVTNA